MNRGDTCSDPSAQPTLTLTVRQTGAGDAKPFRAFSVERCRFTTVASLQRHHAWRKDVENLPDGVRYSEVLSGRGESATTVNELTLK